MHTCHATIQTNSAVRLCRDPGNGIAESYTHIDHYAWV